MAGKGPFGGGPRPNYYSYNRPSYTALPDPYYRRYPQVRVVIQDTNQGQDSAISDCIYTAGRCSEEWQKQVVDIFGPIRGEDVNTLCADPNVREIARNFDCELKRKERRSSGDGKENYSNRDFGRDCDGCAIGYMPSWLDYRRFNDKARSHYPTSSTAAAVRDGPARLSTWTYDTPGDCTVQCSGNLDTTDSIGVL